MFRESHKSPVKPPFEDGSRGALSLKLGAEHQEVEIWIE